MKSLPKIALTGPKGGGKTWVINEVGRRLEFKLQEFKMVKHLPPITTLAFADPIYEIQLDLFDFISATGMTARDFNEWLKQSGLDETIHPVIGMSPRGFRQQFGTEFARSKNADIWLNIVKDKLERLSVKNSSAIIIFDVRMPNEVEMCKEKNFFLAYVNSMGVSAVDSHETESHFSEIMEQSDFVVSSKSTSNMLVDKIVEMLSEYIEQNYTKSGLIVPKGKMN